MERHSNAVEWAQRGAAALKGVGRLYVQLEGAALEKAQDPNVRWSLDATGMGVSGKPPRKGAEYTGMLVLVYDVPAVDRDRALYSILYNVALNLYGTLTDVRLAGAFIAPIEKEEAGSQVVSPTPTEVTPYWATLRENVPNEWISFVLDYNDIFMNGCIGYWGRGIRVRDPKGRLVWVVEEVGERHALGSVHHSDTIQAYVSRGEELPEGYTLLDERAAAQAYAYGLAHWGEQWWVRRDHDTDDYDRILQEALLGEVVYG